MRAAPRRRRRERTPAGRAGHAWDVRARSLTVPKPFGKRIRKARMADRRRGACDVVLHPLPGRRGLTGVEQEPCGPRVTVARLTHAAGVEQPLPDDEIGAVAADPPLAGGD